MHGLQQTATSPAEEVVATMKIQRKKFNTEGRRQRNSRKGLMAPLRMDIAKMVTAQTTKQIAKNNQSIPYHFLDEMGRRAESDARIE